MEATNGTDALQRAREAATGEPFDLVLLDMMLPGIDGLDVLAGLRGDPATRDVPVVIVSARIGVDDQIRGLEAGAIAYLTKPFSIDHLRGLIRAVGAAPRSEVERRRSDTLGQLRADDPARWSP